MAHGLTTAGGAVRRTGVTEYLAGEFGSLRLDVGGPYHFAPFLGLGRDQRAEIGGRARECHPAQVTKSGLHVGVRESSVDFPVKGLNDFRWRGLRRCDTSPKNRAGQRAPRAVGAG